MENAAKTHPLILIAAASVIVVSLAGTAHLLGWLPAADTTPATPAEMVAAPPASTPSAPAEPAKASSKTATPAPVAAPKPAPARKPASTESSSTAKAPPTTSEPATAPKSCQECGTVSEIRQIQVAGEASGLGAVAGGVVGGLLGNQVGGGSGKKLATVAGAVGGAYAGHQIEKSQRSSTRYEISVAMEDGTRQVLTQDEAPVWRVGDRVKLENGVLRAR